MNLRVALRSALEVVDAERPRIVRALQSSGLPIADLEDVVQIVLTDVVLHWDEQLARLSVRQLCGRVLHLAHLRALNLVRDEKRRRRCLRQFVSAPDDVPLDPERTMVLARARLTWVNALERLPPILREPLRLSIVGDLTCAEIAATLTLPVGTVKTRLRQARSLCLRARTDQARRS